MSTIKSIKEWQNRFCSKCPVLKASLNCPHANITYMAPEEECMQYNGIKILSV